MFRKFKPTYWLYNAFKKSELEHNVALYKKYGLKKSYFSSVSAADFDGLPLHQNIYDQGDSADLMPTKKRFQQWSPEIQQALLPWSKDGYVILRNFVKNETVDTINQDIDKLLKNKTVQFQYNDRKIMFALHHSKAINDLANDGPLKEVLDFLLDKPVEVFQSINFFKGSEQRTHSDSIHMTTYPLGNMIAAWIALEDVGIDQGPLHYYPASHKLPYFLNRDFDNQGNALYLGKKSYTDYEDAIENLIEKNTFKRETLIAKKGDVLIWHANLLHGGNPMNNPELTRKSMVFHYYAKDVICYHELTQRPSFKKQ